VTDRLYNSPVNSLLLSAVPHLLLSMQSSTAGTVAEELKLRHVGEQYMGVCKSDVDLYQKAHRQFYERFGLTPTKFPALAQEKRAEAFKVYRFSQAYTSSSPSLRREPLENLVWNKIASLSCRTDLTTTTA
jgi:hypothetical protein